jgi:CheY-like chemotaxis protein
MAMSIKRVLIVEDEPAIRSLVSLVLDGEGYVVDGAGDGREALDKLRIVRPDALIVDLDLPIMDGRDLVRACRADAAARHIPIVLISGMHDAKFAQELDIQGFLPKPFSLEALLDLLRDVIDAR